MTQHFAKDGTVIPVTLVQCEPNVVTQVREKERDGYEAIQLGVEPARSLNRAESGHVKDLPLFRTLREFRVDESTLKRGEKVDVSVFEPGMKVDVTGISKGRGFAGVMKRHGFTGGWGTHGNKDQARKGGSIASQRQGKVIPGQRMAGRMGTERVTVKNLEIVDVDPEKNILAIKGAIPGATSGLLLVRSHRRKRLWQV